MKKYLSLVMIGLSLMLSGCNKDDNNDPNTPPTGDTGKVRYEATVSDPENFKLLIHYTVGVDISSEAPGTAPWHDGIPLWSEPAPPGPPAFAPEPPASGIPLPDGLLPPAPRRPRRSDFRRTTPCRRWAGTA